MFIGNFASLPGGKAPGGLVTKGAPLGFETTRLGGGPNMPPFSNANVMSNLHQSMMLGGNTSTNLGGSNSIPPGLNMLNHPFLQCKYIL